MLYFREKGFYLFQLGSDDILSNPAFVEQFIELHEKGKVQSAYVLFARSDEILENRDLVERMYLSERFALKSLEIGIEALTQRALTLLGKGVTSEENRDAIELTQKLAEKGKKIRKLATYDIMLFFHPEMSYEDLKAAADFIEECSGKEWISLNIAPRTIGYPGTEFWQYLQEKGYRPDPNKGFSIWEYKFEDKRVQGEFDRLMAKSRK